MRNAKGFTLIELLVVIAIIGVLSSVVLASLTAARNRANDAKRVQDLRQVQRALEVFASDNNGQYPSTGGGYRSQCTSWGGHTPQNVVPGLSPTYISRLPADPQMDVSGGTCCYLYISDGRDYGFMAFNCPTANYPSVQSMRTPLYRVWGVWTPGAASQSWI